MTVHGCGWLQDRWAQSRRGRWAALVVCGMLAAPATASAATTVSLTFDDGWATQDQVRSVLAAHGVGGTFYVNSGRIGTSPEYLTWAQLAGLAADGNEIGGHTVNHPRLTGLSEAELRHEVCDDRTNLATNLGISPVSFAYPFGAHDAAVRAMVRDCGYTSGRDVGGIRRETSCALCPFAETIPPADDYAVRISAFSGDDATLEAMQWRVTQAEEHGGGWVVLMFHKVCDRCDPNDAAVKPETLDAFLDWLEPRCASGTVVKTVGAAMSGQASTCKVATANPVATPPAAAPPPPAATVAPPPAATIPPPPPPPAIAPVRIKLSSGVLRYSRGKARFTLAFRANKVARLKVRLERRVGKRWRLVGRTVRGTAKVGSNRIAIRLRRAKRGRYRTVLTARTSDGRSAKLISVVRVR